MFEKWLNEIKDGLSNKERYADIINELRIAFEAGFNSRLLYNLEEELQK